MALRTMFGALRRTLATVAAEASAAPAAAAAASIPPPAAPTATATESATPEAENDPEVAAMMAAIDALTDPSRIVLRPVYTPPTVQALIRDFPTNRPIAIAQLPASVYASPLRRDILHRCVVWQRDAARQGTHQTKGRSDVRGSTRKLAPQKGRGTARVGSLRAPQFRGGGVAHGPISRSHATELPVKVRELGVRAALAAKYVADQLVFVDQLPSGVFQPSPKALAVPKTKTLFQIMNQHYVPKTQGGLSLANKQVDRKYSSVLLVAGITEAPELYVRSAANLPDVKVLPAKDINVYDVLRHEYLVVDHAARKWLEWRLQK
ncbi:50S ribosomal protein L4 [Allomyces macrogynus ATCC 38327]|uniref:Large ribosomal subunit protein uL4m n=1 Tax=Allomyces macrogynus (strain ATCC 38327) TaxID=578462 RepID=A0A0L0S2D8_ALLM3|nr:50S ribosomal protein L4 [Allomyces macrogynus ATCC 38327]|eukprot:KNE56519.1 50S ribosomal protein L4 [Allomyces macrogynus ATCC 38327]